MVENAYGNSGHLSFLTSLEHLMILLKCVFQGFIFTPYQRILITCRAMQLRFFYVETLLDNVFKMSCIPVELFYNG